MYPSIRKHLITLRHLLASCILTLICSLNVWLLGKVTPNTLRAVFKWLSKVITWLRSLPLVIDWKDPRPFFNQWEAKPKPIAPYTRHFYSALSELQVISRNCDCSSHCLLPLWLVGVIALVLVFRQSFENRAKQEPCVIYMIYRANIMSNLQTKY